MAKTIGVVSLKGGVGKTSVVSSLGAAFSGLGKRTLVIDGNLSSPSLGLHMNVVDPEKTLHHVLRREAHLDEAIYSCQGINIIPASIFDRKEVNPLKLRDKIRSLKKKYDVIVIDSSPSLDEETLAVMLASDEILVVTTPDHSTLSATIKAVELAKKRSAPISGLVLNKVHNKDFEVSFGDVEQTLDIPILAVIPHDVNMLRALSKMEPYPFHKPNSKGSIEFKKLAGVLTGEKYKQTTLKDFFKKLTPSRQEVNRELFYQSAFK